MGGGMGGYGMMDEGYGRAASNRMGGAYSGAQRFRPY